MAGNEKGLQLFKGKPLYAHVLARLRPQVDYLLINANRYKTAYALSGYPIIEDLITDFKGPLAGIQAGLAASTTDWVIFSPCDTPFIPTNYVAKLWSGRQHRNAAFVVDATHKHTLHLLMHKKHQPMVDTCLARQDYKIQTLLDAVDAQPVIFANSAQYFNNINTFAERDYWEEQ